MRKNYMHTAYAPTSRNEFIEAIKEKKDVVVLNHVLLEEIRKEINESISSKKTGKFFKIMSVPMFLMSWNPLGWGLSGLVLLNGLISSAGNEFKGYSMYSGHDMCNKQILIFHKKSTVDLKYDKVSYPAWVNHVDSKKMKKKIHMKG